MGSGGAGRDGGRGEEEGGRDAQFSLLGGGTERTKPDALTEFFYTYGGDGDSTIRFYFLRRALPAL